LVSEEEIKEVAKLMKIPITDHTEHIAKVHTILDYFAILDQVKFDSMPQAEWMPLGMLREDEHMRYGSDIKCLKTRNGYVRSPKLV